MATRKRGRRRTVNLDTETIQLPPKRRHGRMATLEKELTIARDSVAIMRTAGDKLSKENAELRTLIKRLWQENKDLYRVVIDLGQALAHIGDDSQENYDVHNRVKSILYPQLYNQLRGLSPTYKNLDSE